MRYYGKARSYQHFNNLLDNQVLLDCDGRFCYRNAERTVNVSAGYRF